MRIHLCFSSESDEDAALAIRLEKHLTGIASRVTHAKQVRAGASVDVERERQVVAADVILLLISADFVASEQCRAEAQRAVERHDQGHVLVVPVLCRPCLWQNESFSRFRCLPRDEQPITAWADRDAAFTDVASGIEERLFMPAPESEVPCPFPGLEFFDEDRETYFFGRETEVLEAMAKLGGTGRHRRWLQIDGPSGAGKSSFARAGLIPAVRRGEMVAGPAKWCVAVLRPGPDPIASLARELRRALPSLGAKHDSDEIEEKLRVRDTALRGLLADHTPVGHGVLVLVDQLEEAFTLAGADGAVVKRFDALFDRALAATDGPLYLVTTIRSDFTGRMGELPGLEKRLSTEAGRYYLRSMGRDALRRAVEEPTKRVGLVWADGLQDRIVEDAAGSPGALPLVAHALLAVWGARQGRVLPAAAYDALGGVGGALARSADEILETLGDHGRQGARRLLLRLVRIGRGNKDTRQTAAREEALAAAGGGWEAERVLARLSGGRDAGMPASTAGASPRLVVVSGDAGTERVDLVHEALIHKWATLQKWVTEERKALELRDDLEDAARVWEAIGASVDSLPQGAMLSRFREIDRTALHERGRMFLEQAEQAEQQELAAEQGRIDQDKQRTEERARLLHERSLIQRRAIRALGLSVILLLIAGATLASQTIRAGGAELEAEQQAAFALEEKAKAERSMLAEQGARAEVLASQPGRSIEALRLAVQVIDQCVESRAGVPPTAVRALVEGLMNARELQVLPSARGEVKTVAYAPDGSRVATGGEDGIVRLWDPVDGRLLGTLEGHGKDIYVLAFSSRGDQLISGSEDHTARIWDVSTARLRATLEGHAGGVYGVAFSPDGREVATASQDGTVRLWTTQDGKAVAVLSGHTAELSLVRFSPSGDLLATGGDDAVRLWHMEGASGARLTRVLRGHAANVSDLAFSHDGRRLLTGSADKTGRLWDTRSGAVLSVLDGHTHNIYSVAFSPDDKQIVTASWDNTARLWNAVDGKLVSALVGHNMYINGVAFSPDGSRLVTTSRDHTARIWSTAEGKPVAVLAGHLDSVNEVTYSPDGSRILTGSADGTARLWEAGEGKPLATLHGHDQAIVDVAFPASGGRIVTASSDGTARVWNATNSTLMAVLEHPMPLRGVVASPDGERLVTSTVDGVASVWRTRDATRLAVLDARHTPIHALAISPDGAKVITGHEDGAAFVWDAGGGPPIVKLSGHTSAVDVAAFSPDTTRLLTGGADRTARLWDADGGLIAVLGGHAGGLDAVVFSPDGEHAATAGRDRNVYVWSAATGAPLAKLEGHTDFVLDLAFSDKGSRLTSASLDGTIRTWDPRSQVLLHVLSAPEGQSVAFAVSPEGSRFATAGLDGKVRLWEAETGELVGTLPGYAAARGALAFSPDGGRLVFPGERGVLQIYAASRRGFMEQACRLLQPRSNPPVVNDVCAKY